MDSAKGIRGSSLGRRAQVQLSRAKVLGCRTVFHRVVALCSQSFLIPSFYSPSRIEAYLDIGNGCTFASFLSILVPFPGLGTSLTLRSASSHTRSPPESAAEVASSVIRLWKLFGGLLAGRRTDDRKFISHCSEFPVYFLTAERLRSYLQVSVLGCTMSLTSVLGGAHSQHISRSMNKLSRLSMMG